MSKDNKIIIIKIPNKEPPQNIKKKFNYIGEMYLNMIENVNKIKKNLLFQQKEHQPILTLQQYNKLREHETLVDNKKKELEMIDEGDEEEIKQQSQQSRHSLENDTEDVDIKALEPDEEPQSSHSDDINLNVFENGNNNSPRVENKDAFNDIKNEVDIQLNDNSEIVESNIRHEKLKQAEDDTENDLLEEKKELLFKFKILSRSYPQAKIPDVSQIKDISRLKSLYEETIRMLTLDSSVETYKQYLIGGFMLVEFVCGKFLNFDMEGFSQQQILQMNKYNKLLIELGEKSYLPEGSRFPVEVRLLFMIIVNAAIFIVGKMIMKNTGTNLMNMINSMNIKTKPKPKMKSPNINDL